ncbi:TrmH family RNA methyltransferase [Sphingopyxis sp. PET50]|uniref:TrmH family RNA methyltransferase n=1 Tax=Sphingopyxis sp. PET50 TaxID=2976533 RepID=UPI0021AEE491|nr:TrmH family RNA methyltransferase [Sphingopyxis sp. PET50]
MTFWTYLLHCADRTYYTGHTDDLDRRIYQHQEGILGGYTSTRRPVELVWAEAFETREEAKAAELKIKNWSRAKKEALIAKDWDRLKRASIPPAERQARASTSLGSAPRLRSGNREEEEPIITAPPPVIVLVRPQLGENIGKAARAMLNFGLTELRLVTPRDGWPNPDAGPAASGADIVLAEAQVFDSLAAATADCTHIYATTVRKRGVTKPVLTPEAAAAQVRATAGRSAYVFGAERSGLETDDVALAHSIVTVPINPQFASLNLAQAVILLAYEWSKGEALATPPQVPLDPPAPHGELEGLIDHLVRDLDTAGYFFPPDRRTMTLRTLRTALTKTGWSYNDIRMMRGIITALGRTPKKR